MEESSVGKATIESYVKAFTKWVDWCRKRDMKTEGISELDEAMDQYMNDEFLKGYESYVGEKTLASVLFHRPDV